MDEVGDARLVHIRPGSLCHRCSGAGRVGLLGPSGLGLVTRPCPTCAFLARTVNEREAFWDLRERYCNLSFSLESDETLQIFVDIWKAAFPGEPLQADSQLVLRSESWKRLGFQSADPRTDVRTGRFALDQLHFLAVMYPRKLQQLTQDAEKLQYFLAISCFNVTHMILVFFGLVNTATVSPLPGVKTATQNQLLNFLGLCCRSLYSSSTVLNELFVALLELLNATWRLMCTTRRCNVMQHFQEALHEVFDANAIFWDRPREAIEDLRLSLALPV